MRVAIVAEYYPRARDPVLGIWAHRQALAAAAAGADVHVLVLHRPMPPRAALRARDAAALIRAAAPAAAGGPRRGPGDLRPVSGAAAPAQLRHAGAAGRRRRSRSRCGTCGAVPRSTSCTRTTRAPAGDAVRARAACASPLAVSVHGGDLLAVAHRSRAGTRAVSGALGHAARRARELGRDGAARAGARARSARAWCTWAATSRAEATAGDGTRRIVTVGSLIARKRHGDVLRALWLLRDEHPDARVGDRRRRARARAARAPRRASWAWATASASRARWRRTAALEERAPRRGVRAAERRRGVRRRLRGGDGRRRAGDRLPRRGRPGGDRGAPVNGIRLVPPADPEELAPSSTSCCGGDDWRRELGAAARATVASVFTWEACGRATVEAYEQALRG